MTLPHRLLLACLLVTLGIAGCAGNKKERDERSGADVLHERATRSMNSGNYANAIAYFEMLEARFPFSNQAKQGQLDLIYCYYMNGEPESAIDSASQFERENPTHPRVDYALYMRGLANFTGQSNAIYRFFDVDLARRPPDKVRESFSAFAQLVQRYPKSRYAPDARQRMVFLRERLAEYENDVARYYYKRGAYLASLDRARFTMESYDGAPAVAESLRIIIDSYRALGMTDLADSSREVLAANFPEAASKQAKEEEKPWYRFW